MLNKILKIAFFIVCYIIGFTIFSMGSLVTVGIGLGLILGETIFLFKKLFEYINKKPKKIKLIIYITSAIIFSIIYLFLFSTNTIELLEAVASFEKYTQYSNGTISEINDNKIIIDCIINKENEIYELELDNTKGYEVGKEVPVYFDPKNIKDFSLISPIINKMIYFTSYTAIIGPATALIIAIYTSLYRTVKPKKSKEKEIKVKTVKN